MASRGVSASSRRSPANAMSVKVARRRAAAEEGGTRCRSPPGSEASSWRLASTMSSDSRATARSSSSSAKTLCVSDFRLKWAGRGRRRGWWSPRRCPGGSGRTTGRSRSGGRPSGAASLGTDSVGEVPLGVSASDGSHAQPVASEEAPEVFEVGSVGTLGVAAPGLGVERPADEQLDGLRQLISTLLLPGSGAARRAVASDGEINSPFWESGAYCHLGGRRHK